MPSKGIENIFKSRRKKIKTIKYLKYVILTVIIFSIGYVGIKNIDMIIKLESKAKPEPQEVMYRDEDVGNIIKIPEEIKNSKDPIVQILLEKSKINPEISTILSNIELYPKELLELASKKDEVVNYVAYFPEYKEVNTKQISIKEDYVKGEIPLFIQWDERWGYEKYGPDYFAINGCGPSSLAMVIVGLTGNTDVNPKSIAEFSENNGHIVGGVGTSWQLMKAGAEEFGLTCKELPLSESIIIDTLKNNQPIIVSMGVGTFTSVGHYIVLTGVDSDGKIIVNDSDSKIKSSKTWDIDVFMKEAKNLWAFSVE